MERASALDGGCRTNSSRPCLRNGGRNGRDLLPVVFTVPSEGAPARRPRLLSHDRLMHRPRTGLCDSLDDKRQWALLLRRDERADVVGRAAGRGLAMKARSSSRITSPRLRNNERQLVREPLARRDG